MDPMVLLLVLPALVAIVAAVIAVHLLRTLKRREPALRVWSWIAIGVLTTVALGIGTCYGAVLFVR